MRKELAKLCLDVITAVVISGLFSGMEENWQIYLIAFLLVVILIVISYYLFNDKK